MASDQPKKTISKIHWSLPKMLFLKNFANIRLFWNQCPHVLRKNNQGKKQMAAKCYTTTEKPRRISNVLINYSDNGC